MLHTLISDPILYIYLTDGADFNGSLVQEIIFSSGKTVEFVSISIEDDNIFEADEEFFGYLTTLGSAVVITEPKATVIITDNDGKSGVRVLETCVVNVYIEHSLTVVEIGFNPSNYVVHESGGTVVTLVVQNTSPAIETEITVQVTFTGELAKGTS